MHGFPSTRLPSGLLPARPLAKPGDNSHTWELLDSVTLMTVKSSRPACNPSQGLSRELGAGGRGTFRRCQREIGHSKYLLHLRKTACHGPEFVGAFLLSPVKKVQAPKDPELRCYSRCESALPTPRLSPSGWTGPNPNCQHLIVGPEDFLLTWSSFATCAAGPSARDLVPLRAAPQQWWAGVSE